MIKSVKLLREFHPFIEGETFNLRPITLLVGDQGAGKSTLIELILKYQRPEMAAVNPRFAGETYEKKSQFATTTVHQESKIERVVDLSYSGNLEMVYIDCEKHNPRMSKGEFTKEYKDAMTVNLRDESLLKIIQTIDGYKSSFPDKDLLNKITNKVIENVGLYFNEKMKTGHYLGDEEGLGMDMTMAFATTMVSHGQTIFPLIDDATKGCENKIIILDEPETALSMRSQRKLADIILGLSKKNQIIIATHSSIIMAKVGEVLSLEHKKWMPANEFMQTQMIISA